MTQTEMQLGMTDNRRLAVRTIRKDGILEDALLLAQGTLQQQIGSHTQALTLLVLETKGLLAALLADGLQGLLEVKSVCLVVDINHFGCKITHNFSNVEIFYEKTTSDFIHNIWRIRKKYLSLHEL